MTIPEMFGLSSHLTCAVPGSVLVPCYRSPSLMQTSWTILRAPPAFCPGLLEEGAEWRLERLTRVLESYRVLCCRQWFPVSGQVPGIILFMLEDSLNSSIFEIGHLIYHIPIIMSSGHQGQWVRGRGSQWESLRWTGRRGWQGTEDERTWMLHFISWVLHLCFSNGGGASIKEPGVAPQLLLSHTPLIISSFTMSLLCPSSAFQSCMPPARITSISSQECHVLTQNELKSPRREPMVHHQSKEAICISPVSSKPRSCQRWQRSPRRVRTTLGMTP